MSEELKLEQLKAKIEMVKSLTNTTGGAIGSDWVMKNIFGFDSKREIRKHRINSIYGI